MFYKLRLKINLADRALYLKGSEQQIRLMKSLKYILEVLNQLDLIQIRDN